MGERKMRRFSFSAFSFLHRLGLNTVHMYINH
jgi:hypothetical protein